MNLMYRQTQSLCACLISNFDRTLSGNAPPLRSLEPIILSCFTIYMAGPIVSSFFLPFLPSFVNPIIRDRLGNHVWVNYKSPALLCLSQIARNLNGNEVRSVAERVDRQ